MGVLTIDGRQATFAAGQTVLDVARRVGIDVPTLCYHPDLSSVGSCRLCLVEVAGGSAPAAACTLAASDGMVVRTRSAELIEARRFILEMLLANFPPRDPASRGDTEFLRYVREYGAHGPAEAAAPRYPVDADPHPLVRVDLNQCILCTRCVRACAEVQGRHVWGVGYRGAEARIVAGLDSTMLEARCESCGACVAYCPTGALDDRRGLHAGPPDAVVSTICGYCGVGCQLDLNVKDGRIARVTSRADAPVNGLALCVKGRYGYDFVHHADRLTRPRVRAYLLDQGGRGRQAGDRGTWVDVDWSTALAIVVDKLLAAKRAGGPDAVAFLSSAKCTNEENYLVQKLARQVIGTNNVDHCARLCHASTVAGLTMCYGSGAMSNSMDDLAAHAQAMFVIGSNTTEQHPVFGSMIRRAVAERGMKLVVADPRRIDLVECATVHLQHAPGSDVALLNGLMHLIVEQGWHDEAFIHRRCEGFDDFRATLERYTPDVVARLCGVPADDLRRAAEILGTLRPLAAVWAMGITQHTSGVPAVLCLGNLQMLTGNMGIPGGGVNPLRGQNNVQGACDMGALPNVLPGYQSVADATAREKFSAAWGLADEAPGATAGSHDAAEASGRSAELEGATAGLPSSAEAPGATSGLSSSAEAGIKSEGLLSSRPGLTVTEMIDGAGVGTVRALYIVGENPVLTDPDSNHVRACLAASEFVVLQEILPSATSEYADVLLPAASFAEKDGTFTNTERRVQLVRAALPPPGEARQDWQIVRDVAERLLAAEGRRPRGHAAAWDYRDPSAVHDEIARLTPLYAGVSHARLARGERLQWPVPSADHPGTPILHVETFTRGKGRFHAVDYLSPRELPDAEFPLLLTTGRVLYHWHGGELTRRSSGLLDLYPATLVEISPHDARRAGIADGAAVRVRSRRGEMLAHALVTDRVEAGVIFANFHFPGDQNANNLTIAALDPVAKIPEYKVCAVAIEPVPAAKGRA